MSDQTSPVRDPVCGMMIDPRTAAAQVQHGGQTFFFCSAACAGKFRANPEQYITSEDPLPPDA